MTVKLTRFFSSGSAVAATTPSHYNVAEQQHQLHQQLSVEPHNQQQYNSYLDDDDNMSLYSTSTSIMTSRDHPYNNSQRPLLPERKPQLLNKKKNAIVNQPQRQHQQQQQHQQKPQPQQPQQQHQHQQHQQKQTQKPYISPYVQRQKRDSAKGLHGFNDFDILSQQYTEHLQNSPHIGYPYGSPPSPTGKSNDFVFDVMAPTHNTASSLAQQHQQQQQQQYLNAPQLSFHYHHNAPANECTDYAYYGDAVESNFVTAPQSHYMGASSRFEDDFCCRRNAAFSTKAHTNNNRTTDDDTNGGPFIFGVSVATTSAAPQQRDLCRDFGGGSVDTVIDVGGLADVHKYNGVNDGPTNMHGSSETSSSSRDSGNGSSNSSKGPKLLLRKSKSKRNNNNNNNKITSNSVCGSASNRDKQSKTRISIPIAQQPSIKCVVVGDAAVGKTNLILSYLENRFNTEHVPTASDIYNADVMVNDSPVHLTICDTAGQDTLDPLRELCYPDSDVFLLCFSVARPETFHSIKTKWAPKFSKTKAALLLVGTQSDLRNNASVLNKLQISGEKPISYADAWDLATTIGAKYIETSSATQDKIKEVFDTAIWEGLAPTTLPPTPKTPLWKKLLCLA